MSEGTESKPGIWASLKRNVDTLLGTTKNRLELFAVELQEEKCRVVEAMLCDAAVAAFGVMTLKLVTLEGEWCVPADAAAGRDRNTQGYCHATRRAWELGLESITICRYGNKAAQDLESGAEEKPLHFDHASRFDPQE